MYNKILFCVKGCQVQDVVPCTSSVQHTQMDMCEGFEEIPLISHSSIQANKKEIAIQTTTNITANSIKCFRSVKTQTDNFFLCVCEETNNQIVRLKSVGLSYWSAIPLKPDEAENGNSDSQQLWYSFWQ